MFFLSPQVLAVSLHVGLEGLAFGRGQQVSSLPALVGRRLFEGAWASGGVGLVACGADIVPGPLAGSASAAGPTLGAVLEGAEPASMAPLYRGQ